MFFMASDDGQCPDATLTGQFAGKLTHDQSIHGMVNSRTSQLADSDFFKSRKDFSIFLR